MIIGVISDTHGALPTAVYKAFSGVDHIIHAGDIGGQFLIDELNIIAPITAVFGNCDFSGDYPTLRAGVYTRLFGLRILITHKPTDLKSALCGTDVIPQGLSLPDLCIHGHTHQPRWEKEAAIRYLCPGSPTYPRGNSNATVVRLQVDNGRVKKLEFVEL